MADVRTVFRGLWILAAISAVGLRPGQPRGATGRGTWRAGPRRCASG